MAMKRDPFKQNFGTKATWDMDKFDNFDSQFEDISVPESKPKGRKPLEEVGPYVTPMLKGATSTMVKPLTDALWRKMPKTKALADEASGFRSAIDDARAELMRGITPMANTLKQLGKAAAPKLEGIMPKELHKKLLEATKDDDAQPRGMSKDEMRMQVTNEAISKALNLQIQQTSEFSSEQRVGQVLDRKISEKQHLSTLSVLNSLRKEAEYRTEFFKTTTVGYYTKSLELKYQSLFVAKDTLATLQVMARVMEDGMKGLLHNSALPDMQKQHMSETIKNSIRGAMINKARDKFSGFVKNLAPNLLKNISGRVSSGLQSMSSAIDMGHSMAEQDAMMRQFDDGSGKKQPSMLGEMGANAAGQGLGYWLTDKASQMIGQKRLNTINNKILKPLTKGPERIAKNLQQKAYLKLKEVDDNRDYGGIKNALKNMMLDALDVKSYSADKVDNVFNKKATDPSPFDIATRTSIVEIIPGYLAKILQQVTISNTGKHVDEQVYDAGTRDFMGSKDYVSSKIEKMHGEKAKRHGAHFAEGSAAVAAGVRHHASSAQQASKDLTTFKDVRKDIEAVMRNHSVEEKLFHPEFIKEYAEKSSPSDEMGTIYKRFDDFKLIEYIQKTFRGIKQPVAVAKFLARALYAQDGTLNTDVSSRFENAIHDLSDDDDYKKELVDLTNVYGHSRFFKDHFDEKKSKRAGDLLVDKDSVIKKYKQDYDPTKQAKLLVGQDKSIYNSLNEKGFSLNSVLELAPSKMRQFAERHVSPERLSKQHFAGKQYNDVPWSPMEFGSNGTADADRSTDDQTYASHKRRTHGSRAIRGPKTVAHEIKVISTTGEHVLLKPIEDIPLKIAEQLTKRHEENTKRDNHESPPAPMTIAGVDGLQSGINAIAEQLMAMRQENKALSMASMVSGYAGTTGSADPRKVQGMWGAIASLGGSAIKTTGKLMGGSLKMQKDIIVGVTPSIFRAVTAVVPSLITGTGSLLGGVARGAGAAAGGMFTANAMLTKSLFKGAGAALGFGARGVGKLLGFGKGKKTDTRKNIFGKLDKETLIKDVYSIGSTEPVIRAKDFLEGVYTKAADGSMKLVKSVKDISGSVYNSRGDMLLSAKDAAEGLYDKHGSKLDVSKGMDFFKQKFNDMVAPHKKEGLVKKGLKGLGGALLGGAKSLVSNSFMLPGSLTGSMLGLGWDGLKWAGKKAGSLVGKMFGKKDDNGFGSGDITRSFIKTSISDKLDRLAKLASGKKDIAGDTDGDGVREGSYHDYIKKKFSNKNKDKDGKDNQNALLKKLGLFGAGLKSTTVADDSGGMLGTLFDLFGGDKIKAKFATLKDKVLGKLGGMFKGMTGMLGKGLSGLLGVFFGKGALSSIMDTTFAAASGAAGGAGSLLGKAGGAMATAGKSVLELAKKGGASMASTIGGMAGEGGKIAAILEKAKKYIPEKLIKFLKIDKIAPVIAKKLGGKAVATLAARFLGPIGLAYTAGSIVYNAGQAAYNPQEMLGLPDTAKISMSDRLITSLSAAIADGLFAGIIDTKWLAELLGVNTDAYMADTEKKTGESVTSADKAVTEKVESQQKAIDNLNGTDKAAAAGAGVASVSGNGAARPSTGSVPVTDANGNQVTFSIPGKDATSGMNLGSLKPVATTGSGGDRIGDLVKRFESGGEGSKSISWDSTGGTSYGTYQFASKKGALQDFIKYCETEGGEEGKEAAKAFKSIDNWDVGKNWKGTKAAMVWQALADKGYLNKLEHGFASKVYYNRALKGLPPEIRDMVQGNRGLQEMLWSTSTQHGSGGPNTSVGAVPIFKKAYKPGIKPEDFVKAVYQDRGNRFTSSSNDVKAGVANRFREEVPIIMSLLGKSPVGTDGTATASGGTQAPGANTASAGATELGDAANRTGNEGAASSSGGSAGGSSGGSSAAAALGAKAGISAGSGSSSGSGGSASSTYFDTAKSGGAEGALGKSFDVKLPGAGSSGGKDVDTSALKMQGGVDFNSLHPALKERFAAMGKEYLEKFGKPITVTSGKRSLAKQQQLFEQYGPGRAARPNPLAPHIAGIALDANSSDMDAADKAGLLQKYGLWRPIKNGLGGTRPEAWHVELAGSRDPNTKRVTEGTLAAINQKYGAGVSPDSGGGSSSSNDPSLKDTSADGTAAPSMQQQEKQFGGGNGTTQKTDTGNGTTTVPAGGGAGSYTAGATASASSGGGTGTSADSSSSSGSSGGNLTNPTTSSSDGITKMLVDIMTTVSNTLIKISGDTAYLKNIDKLAAGNSSQQASGSGQQAASQESAPKPNAAQVTGAATVKPYDPSPPIDMSARPRSRRGTFAHEYDD